MGNQPIDVHGSTVERVGEMTSVHDTLVTDPRVTNVRVSNTEAHAASKGTQLLPINDVTNWTVSGGLARDSSDSWFGGTSVEAEKESQHARSFISFSFGANQDLSGLDFSTAVKVDEYSGNGPLNVRLALEDGTGNRKWFRQRLLTTANGGRLNTPWKRIGWEYDDGLSSGSTDMTDISHVWLRSHSGDTHTLRWNDFRTHPKPSKAYLMFEFDDGGDDDYTTAFPTLGRHGFVGASYILTSLVGDDSKMTLAQMKEMRDRGWEFGGHGHDTGALTRRDKAGQREQFRKCKRFLIRNGFTRGGESFRTPLSKLDGNTHELLPHYFKLMLDAAAGDTGGPASIPAPHGKVGSHTPTSVTDGEAFIDFLIQENHVGALLFHPTETNQYLAGIADKAQTEVEAGNLEVVQPSDLLGRSRPGLV